MLLYSTMKYSQGLLNEWSIVCIELNIGWMAYASESIIIKHESNRNQKALPISPTLACCFDTCLLFQSRVSSHKSQNWSMSSTLTRRKWAQTATQQDFPSTACSPCKSWACCLRIVCISLTHCDCTFCHAQIGNLEKPHTLKERHCFSVYLWRSGEGNCEASAPWSGYGDVH